MGGVLRMFARIGTWWRGQTRPGCCRECGLILRDDNESGFCSDECHEDWLIRTDF